MSVAIERPSCAIESGWLAGCRRQFILSFLQSEQTRLVPIQSQVVLTESTRRLCHRASGNSLSSLGLPTASCHRRPARERTARKLKLHHSIGFPLSVWEAVYTSRPSKQPATASASVRAGSSLSAAQFYCRQVASWPNSQPSSRAGRAEGKFQLPTDCS